MARYQVTLAYDGTRFFGFQRQPKLRTVQGVVEAALQRLGWQGKSLLAAGRTDTGVHASGQVIAFDLEWQHGVQALQNALNATLPADVSALQVQTAADSFHPRYDARSRTYHYHLVCLPVRHPLKERFAWRVWPAPALEPLQRAGEFLLGEHDFAAFGRAPVAGGSTIRRIFRAEWQPTPDGLTFILQGNAFLYRMVRRIVALLVPIGQGNLPPDVVREKLVPPFSPVQGLAPARGLTLVHVAYPPSSEP
ncbi:MAG: tRNA pseudouridine(38-40) synthase TruA [Anaerolineae bacterium]|nr:MAG: tRNA pseudouridine(38-40) synthase TruA [Anaerolineae bacterium]